MSWNIDALFAFPEIGSEVSRGAFGVNVFPAANGAGFVWARNGAAPVDVGPLTMLSVSSPPRIQSVVP